MEESWRWFGPGDTVPLHAIRQAGASGVVTALHDIPYGELWTVEAIAERQALIGADPSLGLRWTVVESLPVHERFKLGEGDLTQLLDTYRGSLRNLAAAGIRTVCYNFMPVVDWTRTRLRYPLPGGGSALRFDADRFAAFDCFMLARPGAEADHPADAVRRGRAWFGASSESDRDELLATIMAGLPGAFDRYDIPALRDVLDRYRGITAAGLRENLRRFLEGVVPVAEELGMRLAIHPDDPPRPILGLPRIASSEDDLRFIIGCVPSLANGITLCTGSLGAGAQNDVPTIARALAGHIHFVHLRNVIKEPDGSFTEAEHLSGDTDMVSVIDTMLIEQARRREAGNPDRCIPFRPDHGHELLDDVGKPGFPGYSAIGRLKGLAELRGVMAAIRSLRGI